MSDVSNESDDWEEKERKEKEEKEQREADERKRQSIRNDAEDENDRGPTARDKEGEHGERDLEQGNEGASLGHHDRLFGRVEMVRQLQEIIPQEVRKEVLLDDERYDGSFLGAGDKIYDGKTDLKNIEGIGPNNGRPEIDAKVVYINGIWTSKEVQRDAMQTIANDTGARVVGLHNGTSDSMFDVVLGGIRFNDDLRQSVFDKLGIGENKAVDTLDAMVKDAVIRGEDLNIISHSQGALETSRALRRAIRELHMEGMKLEDIREAMQEHVYVQTCGGAALSWPDGPRYRHHSNVNDVVPMSWGIGPGTEEHAGKGAEFDFFTERHGNAFANHDISVYAKRLHDDFFPAHRQH